MSGAWRDASFVMLAQAMALGNDVRSENDLKPMLKWRPTSGWRIDRTIATLMSSRHSSRKSERVSSRRSSRRSDVTPYRGNSQASLRSLLARSKPPVAVVPPEAEVLARGGGVHVEPTVATFEIVEPSRAAGVQQGDEDDRRVTRVLGEISRHVQRLHGQPPAAAVPRQALGPTATRAGEASGSTTARAPHDPMTRSASFERRAKIGIGTDPTPTDTDGTSRI